MESYTTYPTWRRNDVTTTDATPTTVATVEIPASTAVSIEVRVTARRTGGSAGTADDSAFYVGYAVYKDVAGTETLIASSVPVALESQAGWDFTFDATGTTAIMEVTGAVDNNVSWLCQYRVVEVTSL